MPKHVPLNELAVAVQSAVEQVLGKHGAVPIDKLWVGFVAPENIATQENATKIAAQIGKEAGVTAHASVGQLGAPKAAGAVQTEALRLPGHIIGLVYQPRGEK
ncbi:MAG TPA: hypothetical protein VMT15_12385 [Bryobacteraceae bacterium]|nr:hypothetical protein [Bryobacteraceae bacterium]